MKRIRSLALLFLVAFAIGAPSPSFGQGGTPIAHGIDRTASGSITAVAQTVILPTNGMSSALITLGGTFVATCQVKLIGADGTSLSPAQSLYPWGTETPSPVTSLTTTGSWELDGIGGKQFVEVVCSAYTSGTVVVTMTASTAPSIIKVNVIAGGTGASGTVTVASQVSTLTDRSGSITSGGTAQQLAAPNSSRRYYIIQNTSTGDLWYSFTGTAVVGGGTGSFRLPAGATLISDAQWVSSQAISIIGATTGQTWTAGEN